MDDMRDAVVRAIVETGLLEGDEARSCADAAIAAVFEQLREPSDELLCAALRAAEIDGGVYHLHDFRAFVNGFLLAAEHAKEE